MGHFSTRIAVCKMLHESENSSSSVNKLLCPCAARGALSHVQYAVYFKQQEEIPFTVDA